MDWAALEESAKVLCGTGETLDGASLAELRGRIVDSLGEACAEVAQEAQLITEPGADLLVVDRKGWIAGNVRTLSSVFGEASIPVTGPQAKVVAWEGGAFLGLISRAVLAQYDPYRDCLIVVYPNLGAFAKSDALRWLLFHEVTHLGQFRTAPWMSDHIADSGRELLSSQDAEWMKDMPKRLVAKLPELVAWVKGILEGSKEASASMPLLDLLPPEHKQKVMQLNAMLTVLEGHATLVTDLIGERVLDGFSEIQDRMAERRKRPGWLRLIEAVAGLEMKRNQYVLGRQFCAEVWEAGGAEALAPFWSGPEATPTTEELSDPKAWLRRVS